MEPAPPPYRPKLELLEDSRVVLPVGGLLPGVTVPGTRHRICVVYEHTQEFVLLLVPSGLRVELWDERPDRKPHWRMSRTEKEQPYACFPLPDAFRRGKEFFDAAVAAGAILDADDAAIAYASMSHGAFVVASNADPVEFRRAQPPKPKRRRITQKILDGGTDITA